MCNLLFLAIHGTKLLARMLPRLKVLSAFKRLHRAAEEVFHGDANALSKARDKIRLEFRQNAHVKR